MERGVEDMIGDAVESHQARLAISMAESVYDDPDDSEHRAMVEGLISGLLSAQPAVLASRRQSEEAGVRVTAEEQSLFDALSMRFSCKWDPKPPGKPMILIMPDLFITHPYIPGSVDVIAGAAPDPAQIARVREVGATSFFFSAAAFSGDRYIPLWLAELADRCSICLMTGFKRWIPYLV